MFVDKARCLNDVQNRGVASPVLGTLEEPSVLVENDLGLKRV